jgi:hypothetical protein
MSRNQVQFVANATLNVSEVPVSDMSVREIVSKISLSGGQGFVLITCTKYCLKMALTCTIYENNFKSEVMKGDNQKQKKHNIQHA